METARILLTWVTVFMGIIMLRYNARIMFWHIGQTNLRVWVFALYFGISGYPTIADMYGWLLNLIFGG